MASGQCDALIKSQRSHQASGSLRQGSRRDPLRQGLRLDPKTEITIDPQKRAFAKTAAESQNN